MIDPKRIVFENRTPENPNEDYSGVLDFLNVCIEKKKKKDFSDPIKSSLRSSLSDLEFMLGCSEMQEPVELLKSKMDRISSNLRTDSSDFGLFHYISSLIPCENSFHETVQEVLGTRFMTAAMNPTVINISDGQAVSEYLMTWLRRSCTKRTRSKPHVIRIRNTLFVVVPLESALFLALVHADKSDLDNKAKFIESFDIAPLPF